MSHKDTATISRQRRWQLKKTEQGLCECCGSKKAIGRKCMECGIKGKERRRKNAGYKAHVKGGAGRTPIYND